VIQFKEGVTTFHYRDVDQSDSMAPTEIKDTLKEVLKLHLKSQI